MRRFATVALGILIHLLTSFTLAQQTPTTSVPTLIRYSGVLTEVQGTSLSGTKQGVSFAIYNQQEGGAPVWLETQNVSVDAAGHYSVLLGSTTAAGLPDDLFSSQEQRWLGVQVQGQPEQPRVLLVSVPYAMKAGEADRLAGHSVSEFVTTDNLQTAVKQQLQQQTTVVAESASTTANSTSMGAGLQTTPTNPATNFVDTTTDQVVSVAQNGTGKAIYATASKTSAIVGISHTDAGVYGISTATTGQTAAIKASSSSPLGYGLLAFETATTGTGFSYGIYGTAASTLGVGIRGKATAASGTTIGIWGGSASTAGYGIKATADATSGNTVGLQAAVKSPAGTGLLVQNLASGSVTGMLLQAGTKAGTQFSVDGNGNVTSAGTFRGNGSGLTGLQLSQMGGLLGSAQFGGSYGNAVTLSNTSNVFYGEGSHLTGISGGGGGGGGDYIWNGTTQQPNANFNISGTGTANAFNSTTNYQIGGVSILSIGSSMDDSLSLGPWAGYSNLEGAAYNTFLGYYAGTSNTTGYFNTFSGSQTGVSNTIGDNNTFTGSFAGYSNSTGQSNTFLGEAAGANHVTGDYDIYIGQGAGQNDTTGSNDIYIGNPGPDHESYAVRIGSSQAAAYIAGIYGSTAASGVPVYINSDGKLGTLTSSLRFKEQVRDMGGSSSALMKLRPVTFLYKPEYDKGQRTLQYGLIAEEVAEVYPELVAYEPDGTPYTVKYQYLAPMLLNEMQKQHAVVAAQQERIKSLQEELQQQREEFQERLSRLEKFISQVPTVPQE